MNVPRNKLEAVLMAIAAKYGIALKRITTYRYTMDDDNNNWDAPSFDPEVIDGAPEGMDNGNGATAEALIAYFVRYAESCD